MHALLWGIAGGSVIVLAGKAHTHFRTVRENRAETAGPGASGPWRIQSGLQEAFASTRAFFLKCKQESEADRIAVQEVRNPLSGKVVRIY